MVRSNHSSRLFRKGAGGEAAAILDPTDPFTLAPPTAAPPTSIPHLLHLRGAIRSQSPKSARPTDMNDEGGNPHRESGRGKRFERINAPGQLIVEPSIAHGDCVLACTCGIAVLDRFPECGKGGHESQDGQANKN